MQKYKMKEIGNIISGGTPSTNNPSYWDGDIPWITPKDLSKNTDRYIYNGERNITIEGLNNSSAKIVPYNTVLLSSRAPIGYLALAGTKLCTNQGFKSIICNEKTILPEYLYYLLKTKIDDLINISSGSTFLELSKTSFENYEINIHNKDIQQHIVNTIGSIDDLIKKKYELISKLSDMSSLLYNDFTNKLEEKNKVNLIDYIDIVNGYSYSGEELRDESNIGMLTIKNFDRNGGFKIDGFKSLKPIKNKYPLTSKFALLIAHTDLTQNAEIIGNPILLLNSEKYKTLTFSMDIVQVIAKKEIGLFYLYEEFKSIDFKKYALGYTHGTTVLHLNKNALKEYTFYIPKNLESTYIIDSKIKQIYEKISFIYEEIDVLIKLKANYLKKFFG